MHMTTEMASPAAVMSGPDIHVWMTPEEAAQALSTPVEAVERQLDEGDLDSRVNEEGMLEVLICLPKRAPAPAPEPEVRLPAVRPIAEPVTLGQTMLPLIHAMRHTHTSGDEIRRARRSARRAWAMAAAVLIAAGGAVAVSAGFAVRARSLAAQVTGQLDQSSAQAANLVTDKDTMAASVETLREANAELTARLGKLDEAQERLKSQLTKANESLTKAQGDLAVERNVEDQLLQAALASHTAKGTPKNQVVADGSN